jgi:hypothetical protein
VRYFAGELEGAATDLVAVEQHFLSHCHGMSWELATTRSFACFALRLVGRVRELCERFDRDTADADRTGDRYLAANLRTYLSVVWLIRDDPARARRDIDGVLQAWPDDAYQVQHFFHLYARCEQAIYSDRPEEAWQAIRRDRGKLHRSMMLLVRGLRFEAGWVFGRTALAMAERLPPRERSPFLRQAERSARIACDKPDAGVAFGIALQAAATWLGPGGKQKQALLMLERAVAAAETVGAMLLAQSGRWWLGELVGGERGQEMRARAHEWMVEQGVQNPERLAHLMVPGFRRG